MDEFGFKATVKPPGHTASPSLIVYEISLNIFILSVPYKKLSGSGSFRSVVERYDDEDNEDEICPLGEPWLTTSVIPVMMAPVAIVMTISIHRVRISDILKLYSNCMGV